jgi:hypothetical protein
MSQLSIEQVGFDGPPLANAPLCSFRRYFSSSPPGPE